MEVAEPASPQVRPRSEEGPTGCAGVTGCIRKPLRASGNAERGRHAMLVMPFTLNTRKWHALT